jgi:hypothetical protein
MAVSIISEPDNFAALYDIEPFIFDSGNKNETNYKYLIEVDVDNQTFNFELPPYAGNGYGVFSVQDLVSSIELNNDPKNQQFFEVAHPEYTIRAGEKYIDSNGNQVKNTNQVARTNLAINAARPHNTSFDFTSLDFLTDNPNFPTIYRAPGQPALLPFRKTNDRDNITVVGVTSVNINKSFNSTVIFDGNQISAGDSYDGQFEDSNGVITKQFRITTPDCIDSRVTPLTLVWLNRYGAYDSWPFTLKHDISREISYETYKKRGYSINDSSPYYEETKRGYKKFGINSERIYTLRSNWIQDDELKWLSTMFDSPEVFLHDGNGYQSVIVESDEIEEKLGQKLFNLEVQIRQAQNTITQKI